MIIDGHMHLEYGPLSEEYALEFVEEAKRKGIDHIQILDHTHRFKEFEPCYEPLKKYPVQKEWLENKQMKFKDSLDDYISLMERIKAMDLPIKVTYGLEVCYTVESEAYLRELLSHYHFDFLVGAVHSIDGILYDMKFSHELLWDKYPVNDIYKRYYELLKKCICSNLFTQLAHPDTIKLFEIYPTYDLKPTYYELADLIKSHHMLAECNVGCHFRYNHPDLGLSDEMLSIFVKEDVPLITASDAHHPKDCGNFIIEADRKIKHFQELKAKGLL